MSMRGRLPAVCGCFTAVLLFEIILRHLYFGLQTWEPNAGWKYRNIELRRYLFEGGSTSRWDARGVRIVPGATPAGPRILVVGNSYTQGTQVGDADVYTAILQKELRVPVLNAGRDAQTPADDGFAASDHLASLAPAWTIIQVTPHDFDEADIPAGSARFVQADRELVLVPPRPHFGRFSAYTQPVRRASALVNVGVMRFAVLRDMPIPPLFHAADPPPPAESPRYGPVERELDALRAAYRGRVTMFLIPEFLDRETSAEARFARWCVTAGVSCVNMRSAFGDFDARGRAPVGFANSSFGTGHLNVEGHAAAAQLLGREIERLRARGLF